MKKALYLLPLLLAPMLAHSDCDRAQALFDEANTLGDAERKLALFEQATQLCPNFAGFYLQGKTLYSLERYDDALLSFKEALANTQPFSDEEAKALAQLAMTHFAKENPMQAAIYIDKAYAIKQEASADWIKRLRRDIDLAKANVVADAGAIDQALLAGRSFGVRPKIQLNSITFKFDSAELTGQGQRQVLELGKSLAKKLPPNGQARLTGHTDKQGSDSYNQALSERRAEAVRQLLTQRHPELRGLLQTKGKGETELKYPGDSEQDHQLNRRVEIELL